MSDYSITAIDYTTLPAALLAIAKQHMRVDFADDDLIIQRYIASAIDHVEQFSGWRIFGNDVSWFPVLSTSAYQYPTPVQPVSTFTVMAGGVPQTDVSAEYALIAGSAILPWYLKHIDMTPFQSDATITLKGGFVDIAKIPPRVSDVILRIAATFYENRESVASPPLMQMPFWMNDMITGIWIPRA